MLPVAGDVDRLLLHDKYLRILAVEMLTLFPLLATALYIFTGNQLLAASLIPPAIITLPIWLRWESRRKRRVMGVFSVENARDVILPISSHHGLHYAPLLGARFTIVDAVRESTRVRYLDYSERVRGERVILILDDLGRVLAASSMNRPPRLDTVTRLG